MKPASNPKTSSLSRDSKATASRTAGKASGAATASQQRSSAPARRPASQNGRPHVTNGAAAVAENGQKAARRPQPSIDLTNASMKAIKEDRGTTIALYALFGSVIAGVIYFIALALLA